MCGQWGFRLCMLAPCTNGSEVREAASLCSKTVLTAHAERGSVLMYEAWVVQKQLSDIQEEEDPAKDLVSDENHRNVFVRGIFGCWLWKGFFATVVAPFEELVTQEWGNGFALAVQYNSKALLPCSCGRICRDGEHWVTACKDNGEQRWILWPHKGLSIPRTRVLTSQHTPSAENQDWTLILLFQLAWTHFLGII